MPATAVQRVQMSAGETRNAAVDYTAKLESGELLTGTPTVAEVTTSDLTISNAAVSTGSLTILGDTVATGAAVQFKVVATSDLSGLYTVSVTVGTDATPAQTFVDYFEIDVV